MMCTSTSNKAFDDVIQIIKSQTVKCWRVMMQLKFKTKQWWCHFIMETRSVCHLYTECKRVFATTSAAIQYLRILSCLIVYKTYVNQGIICKIFVVISQIDRYTKNLGVKTDPVWAQFCIVIMYQWVEKPRQWVVLTQC